MLNGVLVKQEETITRVFMKQLRLAFISVPLCVVFLRPYSVVKFNRREIQEVRHTEYTEKINNNPIEMKLHVVQLECGFEN